MRFSRAICRCCSWRARNCPIWLPITCTARNRRSSGSRLRRAEKAMTPIVLPPDATGNANAPRGERQLARALYEFLERGLGHAPGFLETQPPRLFVHAEIPAEVPALRF